MSTIEDLKTVLKDSLDKKGSLDQLKAKLRSDIYALIEDNDNEAPKIPHDNLLINELFKEYLEFNSYKYTKSVFLKESGQPSNLLNKELIMTELHIKPEEANKEMPLIYTLLWNFLNSDDNNGKNKNENIKANSVMFNDDVDNEAQANINVYRYKTDFD